MTNIYSIIESFGRQFWVEPDKFQDFQNFKFSNTSKNFRSLKTEYSHSPSNANIVFFNKVMFVTNQINTFLGRPLLENFRIEVSLLPGIYKKSKLLVFKMRSKKKFRRKIGYRISSRRIRFDNILQVISSTKLSNLQILVNN
jgi:large subunit ribosomal protein L21